MKKYKLPKQPKTHVYGLPNDPKNWGDAADILRAQQGEFGRVRQHREAVIDRLDRIERMLKKGK